MAKIGIIGGTGLEKAFVDGDGGQAVDVETPFGFPSSSPLEVERHGHSLVILNRHGRGHMIPPGKINYRANIYAMKQLGCTHIIATGAVGSLREEIVPRHIVIPDQVIDRTYRRIPTFFDNLAAHVGFETPFCPVMRKHLLNCGDVSGTTIHDGGTYVCMEGPAFSTRAESEMHRMIGGDLIGMTVMPEAKLAREAEIAYGLVAMPTDYDCWKTTPEEVEPGELISEIIGNLKEASRSAMGIIDEAVRRMAEIEAVKSPAHSALEIAIFSDKSCLSPDEVSRLGVLIEKYI